VVTMSTALRDALNASGGRATREQIRRYVNETHPSQWQDSTLPKAYIHHPSSDRFLFKNADGSFSLYDEGVHGANVWEPTNPQEIADGISEVVEASISLERDVESYILQNLAALERGLVLVGSQVTTDVGRIDILAADASGQTVVIELKVGEAKDAAVGQIMRYLGWYQRQGKVRGILVASDFPVAVQYAALAVPNLQLYRLRMQFLFDLVTVPNQQ
jgi:hypothetical protein